MDTSKATENQICIFRHSQGTIFLDLLTTCYKYIWSIRHNPSISTQV